jgi:hypothetical protein
VSEAQGSSPGSSQVSDETLPRRDWFLLPLIVVLVTSALLGVSEVAATIAFAERSEGSCGAAEGAILPFPKPNCLSYLKNAEGPLVEYRYNECGYRSSKPCGPKPGNTLRVALIGTSITLGLYVPADETFAVRTEKALNAACGRPVEVQNLGAVTDLVSQPEIAAKALELTPDVIVLTVAPFDLEQPPAAGQSASSPATGIAQIKLAWDRFSQRIRGTRLVLAVAHFMLLDPEVLYRLYLRGGGSRGVMSFPPTPSADRTYAAFGVVLDRIGAKVKGTGVPIVVAAVPNRVAAAMVSSGYHLEGTDARWFGRHVGEIAAQHGALPLDLTPVFANFPHAEQLFYPADNHPTGEAHALVAQALVARLIDGSIPALAACRALRGER